MTGWAYARGRGAPPSVVPMVRWRYVGVWRRPYARLNTAASRLCEEIVGPPHEIGIRIRRGRNENAGTFALEVVPWRRGDRLAVLLQPRPDSFNTHFHASALVRLQPHGRSELERMGNLLVGTLAEEVPAWTPHEQRVIKPPRARGERAAVLAERLSTTIDLLELIDPHREEEDD